MNDILMIVLKAIVSIATILITGYLVPLMKKKLDSIKDEELKTIIFDAVWAAQQTILDNDEKKAYVEAAAIAWMNDHGINISGEQLDMLIESAVLAMKVDTRN